MRARFKFSHYSSFPPHKYNLIAFLSVRLDADARTSSRLGDVSVIVVSSTSAELNGSRVTRSIPKLIGAISLTCFTDERLKYSATSPYEACLKVFNGIRFYETTCKYVVFNKIITNKRFLHYLSFYFNYLSRSGHMPVGKTRLSKCPCIRVRVNLPQFPDSPPNKNETLL